MTEIKIDRNTKYQTIESFGVSGAWWAQNVGGWSEIDEESGIQKREKIAQLLFDKEEGIGITCYRYNLGSGSKSSGNGKYSEESRRAESFDTAGGYDWSHDKNAVWMLHEAVRLGADDIVFFVNSPPESMTKNHKGHLDRPLSNNLAKKNYRCFADYCLDVTEHFVGDGIPVKYLSPVNEPVWIWTGGQEGCHYRPLQVCGVMKTFADELDKRPSLKGLKLSGAENGDVRWFNKTYCRIMLGTKEIRCKIDAVDTHSYCLKAPVPFINNRVGYLRRYRKWMDRHFPGVPVKTSEWTHIQSGRDYGMPSALEQAKVMYEDLTILNVASWQNWIALSNVDYCDGLLYEFDDTRTFQLTKRYYAFGNFSKYVRPGSVRIKVSCGDEGINAAAFEKDDRVVLVLINTLGCSKDLTIPEGYEINSFYVTDDSHSLDSMQTEAGGVVLAGKSISTLIIERKVK